MEEFSGWDEEETPTYEGVVKDTASVQRDAAQQDMIDWAQFLSQPSIVIEAQPKRGPRVVLMSIVDGYVYSAAYLNHARTAF